MSELDKIFVFLNGLMERTKKHVAVAKPSTLEKAINTAQNMFTVLTVARKVIMYVIVTHQLSMLIVHLFFLVILIHTSLSLIIVNK